MHLVQKRFRLLTILWALTALGGGHAAAQPNDGVVRPLTQGQLKIAHFATADGRVGFVLDRTGPKPKYRADGEKDVIELTVEEDRYAHDLRGYYFVQPNGARRLYLSKAGTYTLYHGHDSFTVLSDRAAEPLPAATISGAPVKEKQPYEILGARLNAIAVRTRMPAMTAEDSSRLAKVGEAIAGATADMFVRHVTRGTDGSRPYFRMVPRQFDGISYGGVGRQSDEAWDKRGAGLKKYGGTVRGYSHPQSRGNHISVLSLAGYPAPLAQGTPGLIWEVESTTAVFVTLDGARYVIDLTNPAKGSDFDMGAGSEEQWPEPLGHALLDIENATSLVKVGEFPKKVEEELFAQDDAWNTCAQKVWAGAQRKIDSNKFTEADRKDFAKKAEQTCAAPVRKQEATFVSLVEARSKARQALFDKARARIRELTKK